MSKVNRIWLTLGQSLMSGQGNTNSLLPATYKSKYLHNARNWQVGGFQVLNSDLDNCSNPTAANNRGAMIYFMGDYADAIDADVYILNYSQGAVGLALDAGAVDFNPASVAEFYDGILADIVSVKAWMTARGKSYVFEGAIWWQGQEDSLYGSKSSAYLTNLNNFFGGIITASGNANFKIIQDYVEDCPNTVYSFKTTVNTAKDSFTALDSTNRYVYQPNYVTYYDGTHPVITEYLRTWTDFVLPKMITYS